jgi:hypothetical protein
MRPCASPKNAPASSKRKCNKARTGAPADATESAAPPPPHDPRRRAGRRDAALTRSYHALSPLVRSAGCTPASRPSPTATCTSGTRRAICLNFGAGPGVRGQVQPALRRHEPGEGEQEYVDSIIKRCGVARGRLGRPFRGRALLRQPTTSSGCTISPGEADQEGQGLRLRAEPPMRSREPRHADRAGQASPFRDRPVAESLA